MTKIYKVQSSRTRIVNATIPVRKVSRINDGPDDNAAKSLGVSIAKPDPMLLQKRENLTSSQEVQDKVTLSEDATAAFRHVSENQEKQN